MVWASTPGRFLVLVLPGFNGDLLTNTWEKDILEALENTSKSKKKVFFIDDKTSEVCQTIIIGDITQVSAMQHISGGLSGGPALLGENRHMRMYKEIWVPLSN